MNSRLLALIDRGYSKDEVMNLANFTEEELLCGCIKHPDSALKKLVCKGGGKVVITDKTFEAGE